MLRQAYFNPRSPWGERRHGIEILIPEGNFNPRSPWGERLISPAWKNSETDFNPRSPWGERPDFNLTDKQLEEFQSTLPVGGATSGTWTFNK